MGGKGIHKRIMSTTFFFSDDGGPASSSPLGIRNDFITFDRRGVCFFFFISSFLFPSTVRRAVLNQFVLCSWRKMSTLRLLPPWYKTELLFYESRSSEHSMSTTNRFFPRRPDDPSFRDTLYVPGEFMITYMLRTRPTKTKTKNKRFIDTLRKRCSWLKDTDRTTHECNDMFLDHRTYYIMR